MQQSGSILLEEWAYRFDSRHIGSIHS